jgi:hypothetical protein
MDLRRKKTMDQDQISRIKRMEANLDAAREAVDRLSPAIDQYEAAQKKYFELEEYYSSRQWRKDFEDDEAGRLPEDLKRGVLSEDAVYDLITEHSDLILRMNRVALSAMAEDRIRRNEE